MSWPLVKLGDVVDIKGGGTPSKSNPEFWDGDIPWASVKDFKSSSLKETADYITNLGVEKSATNVIPAGNVIVPTRMALGKVAINEVDMAINQDLKALLVNDEKTLSKLYLMRFLESKAAFIDEQGKGATVKGITLDVLRNLEIPLPPLPEQKRIAAILDKADTIRRKRQQAIQLADDFLRAVFLDMFGDPVTNPKGWPKKALKLLGKSATGRTPPSEKAGMWGEGLPFVTPGDLSGRVDSSVREVTQEGAEHSKVCRTGSLLVCCIGATIGKVGIAGCPVAFNQQINAQEWGAETSDAYGFFVFKLFPELVRERAIQTTLPILKKSLFDEIEIPVPTKDLQEKFAAIAQKITSFSARHESGVEMPIFESLSQLAFSEQL